MDSSFSGNGPGDIAGAGAQAANASIMGTNALLQNSPKYGDMATSAEEMKAAKEAAGINAVSNVASAGFGAAANIASSANQSFGQQVGAGMQAGGAVAQAKATEAAAKTQANAQMMSAGLNFLGGFLA